VDIEEPKKRMPTRFEEGTAEGTFFDNCEVYFCSIYVTGSGKIDHVHARTEIHFID